MNIRELQTWKLCKTVSRRESLRNVLNELGYDDDDEFGRCAWSPSENPELDLPESKEQDRLEVKKLKIYNFYKYKIHLKLQMFSKILSWIVKILVDLPFSQLTIKSTYNFGKCQLTILAKHHL